jgi:hypothetical protein
MNMEYEQEPSYGHLKFLLSVPLLDQDIVPSDCVLNRVIPNNILLSSHQSLDLDCDDIDAVNDK